MALQLMLAPGSEVRARTAGRKMVVETDGCERNRYCFAMLPNERSPRTLIPIEPGSCTRRALQQIQVFATGAKAAKLLLQVMTAVGALPAIAKTLVVSAGPRSGLFDKIAQLTGRSDLCFGVNFGTPSRYRKLTVFAMLPDGEPVAFAKVPMAREAIARVENEGEMLHTLSRTALAHDVPRALFSGEWNGQTVLCTSAGPTEAASMRFAGAHRSFLETLWSIRPAVRDGEQLVSEVGARLNAAMAPDHGAAQIVSEALEYVRRRLKGATISCGLSHGDFAPWNLRISENGMFAFDWEAAAWDQPNLWDIAHFDTQLVTLLGHRSRYHEIAGGMAFARELYLLYLLNSMAAASCESGEASKQVSDRVRLLTNVLKTEN
jgi:hypothetical protein